MYVGGIFYLKVKCGSFAHESLVDDFWKQTKIDKTIGPIVKLKCKYWWI